MNLDRFIGDEATFPLEHRILNTVLLMGIVIAIFTTVFNYLIGLEFPAAVSFVCIFILGALYYLSIVKKSYRNAIVSAIILIFAVTPVLWICSATLSLRKCDI